MQLYITPTSPYARVARIAVIEKGLGERVEIILALTRTAGSPYYNPHLTRPALYPPGFTGEQWLCLLALSILGWGVLRNAAREAVPRSQAGPGE